MKDNEFKLRTIIIYENTNVFFKFYYFNWPKKVKKQLKSRYSLKLLMILNLNKIK